MRQRVEQALLGPLYEFAVRLRRLVWRMRRPMLIGVRALIVTGETVLLVRHRRGRHPWALPGGGVERYERLVEAARREALEETGIPVRIERLLGIYDHFGGGISNYIAVFVCTPLGDPAPPCSLEIARACFFAFDELPDGVEQSTRERIMEYLEGKQSMTGLW